MKYVYNRHFPKPPTKNQYDVVVEFHWPTTVLVLIGIVGGAPCSLEVAACCMLQSRERH